MNIRDTQMGWWSYEKYLGIDNPLCREWDAIAGKRTILNLLDGGRSSPP